MEAQKESQGLSGSLGTWQLPPQRHGQAWFFGSFCRSHIDCKGLGFQFLPKNLHLVCVDMPGHEGTTRSSLDDLSIVGQVKRIHQVSRTLHQHRESRQELHIGSWPVPSIFFLQNIANKMGA